MQVPAVEGLTVRVVNNISKKMEVKPRFLETFKNEDYPDTLGYKQKVPHLLQQANANRLQCRLLQCPRRALLIKHMIVGF